MRFVIFITIFLSSLSCAQSAFAKQCEDLWSNENDLGVWIASAGATSGCNGAAVLFAANGLLLEPVDEFIVLKRHVPASPRSHHQPI